MCYHQITHLCQSETLSHTDYESTYTNRASGVSAFRRHQRSYTMKNTAANISDNGTCIPTATAIKIAVTMKSGRTWTGTVTRETAEGASHMERAKRIIQRSLEPSSRDSLIPLSVFLDMFYMVKVSSGCSTIEPVPDSMSPKGDALKKELLAEIRSWIDAVDTVSGLLVDSSGETEEPISDPDDSNGLV